MQRQLMLQGESTLLRHYYPLQMESLSRVETIWSMANSVSLLLKKALSLVPRLSPKLVLIDSMCRVVGNASEKNEALFMQAIDCGM